MKDGEVGSGGRQRGWPNTVSFAMYPVQQPLLKLSSAARMTEGACSQAGCWLGASLPSKDCQRAIMTWGDPVHCPAWQPQPAAAGPAASVHDTGPHRVQQPRQPATAGLHLLGYTTLTSLPALAGLARIVGP